MAQRLMVFLLVGGVAGFGAVFLELPGLVLAGVVLVVLLATTRRRDDLVRVGGYLLGVGVVGWSLVGPAVKGSGGLLYLGGWTLVTLYAVVALAGCVLMAWLALLGIRRRGRIR
jgi:hypothetical protein